MTTPSVVDAQQRYFAGKIPDTAINPRNFNQVLAAAAVIAGSTSYISLSMGVPRILTLFLRASVGQTVSVFLSPDSVDYYLQGTIVLGAGGESVTNLPGASFVKVTFPTAATVSAKLLASI